MKEVIKIIEGLIELIEDTYSESNVKHWELEEQEEYQQAIEYLLDNKLEDENI